MRTDTRPVTLPAEGFVRLRTVLAVFPVSRSEWKRGVKEGRYPAPSKLTPRVPAWDVADIRALIARVQQASQPKTKAAAGTAA